MAEHTQGLQAAVHDMSEGHSQQSRAVTGLVDDVDDCLRRKEALRLFVGPWEERDAIARSLPLEPALADMKRRIAARMQLFSQCLDDLEAQAEGWEGERTAEEAPGSSRARKLAPPPLPSTAPLRWGGGLLRSPADRSAARAAAPPAAPPAVPLCATIDAQAAAAKALTTQIDDLVQRLEGMGGFGGATSGGGRRSTRWSSEYGDSHYEEDDAASAASVSVASGSIMARVPGRRPKGFLLASETLDWHTPGSASMHGSPGRSLHATPRSPAGFAPSLASGGGRSPGNASWLSSPGSVISAASSRSPFGSAGPNLAQVNPCSALLCESVLVVIKLCIFEIGIIHSPFCELPV